MPTRYDRAPAASWVHGIQELCLACMSVEELPVTSACLWAKFCSAFKLAIALPLWDRAPKRLPSAAYEPEFACMRAAASLAQSAWIARQLLGLAGGRRTSTQVDKSKALPCSATQYNVRRWVIGSSHSAQIKSPDMHMRLTDMHSHPYCLRAALLRICSAAGLLCNLQTSNNLPLLCLAAHLTMQVQRA